MAWPSTSRKSEYNGEQNFGRCGDQNCADEFQARVDCESMIGSLESIDHLMGLSGQRLAHDYTTAQPCYTVAQFYKKMDKTVEAMSETLALVNFERDWYESDPNQWQ